MSDAQTKTRRRLEGKALGEVRVKVKRVKKAQRALIKKREELLDEQDLHLDQVPNWDTGVVYDTIPQDRQGQPAPDADAPPTPIGHITKEARAAQRSLAAEVEQANEELEDLVEVLAERLSCMPRDIDVISGQINGEPVVGIDPYDDASVAAGLQQSPDAPAPAGGELEPVGVAAE